MLQNLHLRILQHKLLAALFILSSIYGQAQCIKRTELLALADSVLSQSYANQIKPLSAILASWEHCRYLKDSSYVYLALERAKARSLTGDSKTAIQEIEQTLRLYIQPHTYLKAEDQIKAYYRLGNYWKELNEFERAIEASHKAVKLGEHLPIKWVCFAYTTLVYAYYSAGEYQKAVENAERGMDMAKQINDTIAYLDNSGEKIKALMALSRDEETEKELAYSIGVARKSSATSYNLAFLLAHKAHFELKHLNMKNALAYYNEALQVNLANKMEKNVIQSYNDIGHLFYKTKEYNKAIKNYKIALSMAPDPYLKLRLLDNIGVAYWRKKKYITALNYYQLGLDNIGSGLSKHSITDLPNANLVRTASQKEYVLTLIQDKADTWVDSAKAATNQQCFLYALEMYKVADRMIDFMRWEHTGQQSKLYWREKTRSIYERAIETCFQLKNTEQAFRFFEKSRAAMLADKLNELGAQQQLSPQQALEEQKLQRSVSNQQANLATITASKPVNNAAYKAAQLDLDTEQDRLDRFRKQLETSNPAYYDYKYDTTVTSLADLRSQLKTQQASFVTYFIGDSALYVLGVTADTTLLLCQPIRKYGQNVQAFMKLLWSPDAMNRKASYRQFLALGNGLYNQLLAPLKLSAGRVIVSPDGGIIPFETFSRKTIESDYLVKDYAFSYTYSVRSLLKKQEENKTKTNVSQRDFLGIAPVKFASSLKQVTLSGSEEALKRIAERFHSPELLTNQVATRRAFLTKATEAGVIHLFTHATADSSGQDPILYFADSTLKLSDLGDGALPNAQLVVLAACETGIGAVQQGEGVFSFARGFAALGVPSVLTTLWSVPDKATYELTELFYKYIDEGFPKDIALQKAKRDWLKDADQSNQSPTIWAGLIIVGDTAPLSHAATGMWMAIIPLVTFIGWVWQKQKRRSIQSVSLPHSV